MGVVGNSRRCACSVVLPRKQKAFDDRISGSWNTQIPLSIEGSSKLYALTIHMLSRSDQKKAGDMFTSSVAVREEGEPSSRQSKNAEVIYPLK